MSSDCLHICNSWLQLIDFWGKSYTVWNRILKYIYIMLFIILLLYIIVDLNFYVNGSIPISYEDWMHDSLNFLIHRSDDGFWPGRFHMLWYNLHVQVTACIDIIQYVNTFIIPMSNELHENIIHSVCWHSGFAVIWGRSWVGVEWGWMGALGMLCMDRTIKLGACFNHLKIYISLIQTSNNV